MTGSDNGADFVTKALGHDSIVRHTVAMGCEFMFRRDPIASTVNNMSANVSMGNSALEVENRSNTKDTMEAWTRMDLHRKTYDTTNKSRSDTE